HLEPPLSPSTTLFRSDGDASLGVESELLAAYAAVQPPDVVAVLLPYLARPSRNDLLRVAALRGLGSSQDLSALDPLLSSADKGRSEEHTSELQSRSDL